jgi:hypothetical protein
VTLSGATGEGQLSTNAVAQVTITDDDLYSFALGTNAVSVAENATNVTFTVVRGGATNATSVRYATTAGTATSRKPVAIDAAETAALASGFVNYTVEPTVLTVENEKRITPVGGTLIEPYPSVGHVYAATAAAEGFGPWDPQDLNRRFYSAWQRHVATFDFAKASWARLVAQGRPVDELLVGDPHRVG